MATERPRQRIRLNLLPPEIPAARRAKRLLPFAGVLIIVSVLGSLLWLLVISRAVAAHEQMRDEVKAEADKISAIEAEISGIKSREAPLQETKRFVTQFDTHSARYADVAEAISHYIPDRCTIDALAISGGGGTWTVSFTTVVEDREALTRFMANFVRCAIPEKGLAEQSGSGTEPLWNDDSGSRGALKPLFAPGSVTYDIQAGPAFSTAVRPEDNLTGLPEDLTWVEPIIVTVRGTLAEPLDLTYPAAPQAAADTSGMGMMGAMGGMGGMGETGGEEPAAEDE